MKILIIILSLVFAASAYGSSWFPCTDQKNLGELRGDSLRIYEFVKQNATIDGNIDECENVELRHFAQCKMVRGKEEFSRVVVRFRFMGSKESLVQDLLLYPDRVEGHRSARFRSAEVTPTRLVYRVERPAIVERAQVYLPIAVTIVKDPSGNFLAGFEIEKQVQGVARRDACYVR